MEVFKYTYSCTNAIHDYLKTKNLNELVVALSKAEVHARNDKGFGADGILWLRFGKEDSIAWSIKDIEKDLSLDEDDGTREFLEELFEYVTKDIDPEKQLRLYIDDGMIECPDCNGDCYKETGPNCSKPASSCCGGCIEKVTCDTCGGYGEVESDLKNEL